MTKQKMIQCTTVGLVVSIFFERYCFIVTVYKMKFYGYVLILIVTALNCIFNLVISRLRYEKTTKTLHQMFSIDRTASVGSCIIGVIGTLDMLYAFFLFWPANVLPLYLLIALLQIYIPTNILLRSWFFASEQHKVHKLASLIIVVAVAVNSLVLVDNFEQWGIYYLLFFGSAFFDFVSHGLKESLVRGTPINQTRFNLSISIA